MDAQDFRSLQEAYLEVYQPLDEAKVEKDLSPSEKEDIRNKRQLGSTKNRDNKTGFRREVTALQRGLKKPTPKSDRRKSIVFEPYDDPIHVKSKLSKMRRKTAKNNIVSFREDYDIYDIIFLHLLDEGYAETPEAALAIMANMSEEWREEILDEEVRGAKKGTIRSVIEKGGKSIKYVQSGGDIVAGDRAAAERASAADRKRSGRNRANAARAEQARKKSIENLNAKSGEDSGDYDSGHYGDDDTSDGKRHYSLSHTNRDARRRRASGR